MGGMNSFASNILDCANKWLAIAYIGQKESTNKDIY
jgi:hypothetical protein